MTQDFVRNSTVNINLLFSSVRLSTEVDIIITLPLCYLSNLKCCTQETNKQNECPTHSQDTCKLVYHEMYLSYKIQEKKLIQFRTYTRGLAVDSPYKEELRGIHPHVHFTVQCILLAWLYFTLVRLLLNKKRISLLLLCCC